MSRFPRILPVAALAIATSACIESIAPARETTGFISAVTYRGIDESYQMQLQGAFYRFDGLTPGLPATEGCEPRLFNLEPPTLAAFPTVSAGDFLETVIAGRRDTMFLDLSFGIRVYELSTVNSIPFTPGDTLAINIPGAVDGFPTTAIRVRTAEDFTWDAPVAVDPGQPMPITWTPAAIPGAKMVFSLRYSDGTTELPNIQLYCVFDDDGSGQVPPNLAQAWAASAPASRRTVATRIRLTEQPLDARRKVYLLSYFESPLPPVPGT